MFQLIATFKKPENAEMSFRSNAFRIKEIVSTIQNVDKFSSDWYLRADTKEESFLYSVFDNNGELTAAAEAVLETRYKNQKLRSLIAWNGHDEYENGAAITLRFTESKIIAWTFELEYPMPSLTKRLGGLPQLINIIKLEANHLHPKHITASRYQYFERQVFKDRPGVGWMLYLPKILTAKQVPEAAELIPVMDSGNKQLGTIIVSTTEEFSDENPEHVKKANAIEIRLVDQDLLPRYMDLK